MQKTSTPQQSPSAQETPKPDQRNKKYDKPHMIIPDEDMAWALDQRSPVFRLWSQCWRSDPYGSRWMPLNTTLGRESLKKAKSQLINSGLFLFENRLTIVNGHRIYEWWVKNLHGCRSLYWKFKGVESGSDDTKVGSDDTGVGDAPPDQSVEVGTHNTGVGNDDTGVGNDDTEVGNDDTEVGTVSTTQPYLKSLVERVSKTLINVSVTSHKHFINSLRIVEREGFLEFCLQKITALQTKGLEVHTDHGWIASHYDQYWNEFQTAKTVAALRSDEDSEDKQQKKLEARKAAEEFLQRDQKNSDRDKKCVAAAQKSSEGANTPIQGEKAIKSVKQGQELIDEIRSKKKKKSEKLIGTGDTELCPS